MDRNNFNADQLHEHFDSIKAATGVEFTDDNRMVQLPTGHKFVAGGIQHYRNLDEETAVSYVDIHGEEGQVGHVTMETGNHRTGGAGADVTFYNDPSLNTEDFVEQMHFKKDFKTVLPKEGTPPLIVNPPADYVNDTLSRLRKFNLNKDPIESPGVATAIAFSELPDGRVEASRGVRFGFNSRTKRYEEIPD